MPAKDAIDGWEALTKLTKRTVQFAYIVFLRREKGQATTAADIGPHFKDCSVDLAASVLHEAADAGALWQDEDGQWRVTKEGLAAFRVHFTGWSDQFDTAAEERGLS